MDQRCEGCDLLIRGGTAACQALFDDIQVRAMRGELASAAVQRLFVDTYCLQHPDRYCVSAKSLAAHVTGVCWAVEYGGHPNGLRALQQWLSGPAPIEKPPVPRVRGSMTVSDVHDVVGENVVYAETVRTWARETWDAYEPLHALARAWIERALARR